MDDEPGERSMSGISEHIRSNAHHGASTILASTTRAFCGVTAAGVGMTREMPTSQLCSTLRSPVVMFAAAERGGLMEERLQRAA